MQEQLAQQPRDTGDTARILRTARELLSDESRLCREFYAQDENGADVDPTDKYAVTFDPIGAMMKVAGCEEGEQDLISEAIGAYCEAAVGKVHAYVDYAISDVSIWIDNKKARHADILRAFDDAVRLVKQAAGEKDEKEEDEDGDDV
jgi:hypothetical protein